MYLDPSKVKLLIKQRDAIREWVSQQQCDVRDQRQLDDGTPERLYWHYGYQAALTDLIDSIVASDSRGSSAGTPN